MLTYVTPMIMWYALGHGATREPEVREDMITFMVQVLNYFPKYHPILKRPVEHTDHIIFVFETLTTLYMGKPSAPLPAIASHASL